MAKKAYQVSFDTVDAGSIVQLVCAETPGDVENGRFTEEDEK